MDARRYLYYAQQLLTPQKQLEYHRSCSSPVLENTEFGADSVLDFANQLLMDSRELQGCTLRLACWIAQSPKREDLLKYLRQIHG